MTLQAPETLLDALATESACVSGHFLLFCAQISRACPHLFVMDFLIHKAVALAVMLCDNELSAQVVLIWLMPKLTCAFVGRPSCLFDFGVV